MWRSLQQWGTDLSAPVLHMFPTRCFAFQKSSSPFFLKPPVFPDKPVFLFILGLAQNHLNRYKVLFYLVNKSFVTHLTPVENISGPVRC